MNVIAEMQRKCVSTVKLCSFVYFIIKKGVFKMDSASLILNILGKLAELECTELKGKFCYRNPENSVHLFNALIKVYLKDRSNKTLEQLTAVLKNEIIGRNNGR